MERSILDSAECIKNSAEYMYHFSDLMTESEILKTINKIEKEASSILEEIEKYKQNKMEYTIIEDFQSLPYYVQEEIEHEPYSFGYAMEFEDHYSIKTESGFCFLIVNKQE